VKVLLAPHSLNDLVRENGIQVLRELCSRSPELIFMHVETIIGATEYGVESKMVPCLAWLGSWHFQLSKM
jgi:hypothetical protein